MAMWTIQQLEALAVLAEKGGQHVAARDSARHVPSCDFPRVPSARERVYNAVKADTGWSSRAVICQRMGVKKASWVNVHLRSLVVDKLLLESEIVRSNGFTMFVYAVNPDHQG